ncbi:diaminopimelate decarboxylase [Collinsella sp. AGMB00827]|uniref:Diaminopimelate decarboxylase n=1 Tax=Collinsella ureilytica TaxID=2869515 RepID=A0ABS7MHW4_9ACTN|nr:diaminopimelate decarboxylase [Collinsella urealyticum]
MEHEPDIAQTAHYTDKRPFVSKQVLEKICETYPTPFHLYDEAAIRKNACAVHEAFAWNPGFMEYFAVKANPNPALIRILAEEGCGLDCSSETELMIAQASGIEGSKIMFSSNDTPAQDFVLARRLGAIINFDDITHIPFFESVAGPVQKTVSCRFNPGGLFRLATGIMGSPGDSKYGMTEPQLFEAFRMLKDRGAETFGIHAFLASNTTSDEYYPALARTLFELAVRLKNKTGCKIGFINLSGGVGVPYQPEETPANIAAIGKGVQQAYEEVLVPAGMDDVAIYSEMGRFMLAPYGCLVTRAIHEKHIYKDYIGVDANACNLMRPAMYGAYHHLSVVGQPGGPDKTCLEPDHVYDVVGNLCENNDKFAIDRALPQVEIGDLIVIHDTGAHGHAMGYNYNGRLRSAEVLLKEDGTTQLIRRAERADDYFSTLDVLPAGQTLIQMATQQHS